MVKVVKVPSDLARSMSIDDALSGLAPEDQWLPSHVLSTKKRRRSQPGSNSPPPKVKRVELGPSASQSFEL